MSEKPTYEELEKRLKDLDKESIARKRTEEELSVVYDALNSSVNGVIITSLEGIIKYVNPAFLKIFKYKDKSEVLGKNAVDLFLTEKIKKIADIKAIIHETKGETEEFIAQRKDGKRISVKVSSSNVTDNNGTIVGRMASFIDLSERDRLKIGLQKSQKQIRRLSSKLIEAEERERKLIAQELHDSIGANLTAIKFALEEKLSCIREKRMVSEGISLEQIISLVKDTIEEAQRISSNLRPSILDDMGILSTIRWICRKFQEVFSGIRVDSNLDIQEDDVPEPLKIVICRILQEALNNVSKHSGADTVHLSLRKTKDDIILSIEDNGHGFDMGEVLSEENTENVMGLSSMRERTTLSGGSFEALSKRGKGTIVQAMWPVG